MPRSRPQDTAHDDVDEPAAEATAAEPGTDVAGQADLPSHDEAVAAVEVRDEPEPAVVAAVVDITDWTDEQVTDALAGRGLSADGTAAERAARLTSTDTGGATS